MGQREDILGTILDGRYRVEAVLGAAHAGGTVFRGRDAAAGSNVVVRCPAIPAGLAGAALEEALEAFLAEAELLAKISQGSSDVEKLLASGVADRTDGIRVPYTIFEWLAGRSLERHIAEHAGGSSIGEALVILEPAARALSVAHSMGVAHRDVRPANLWLAEIGGRTTLKVAAFGLATRVGPGDTAFAPEYGAPEHFKKSYGAIGPATDVYGLALCVIEMVTGKRALEGADAGELYLATSDLVKRPTLRARGSHVSDAVEAVLQRALAVDPKRRWASARDLWDALVGAVPELTPAPPSVRTRASDRPPGIGGGSHPGVTPYVDSPPASVPPGLAELARAATASSGQGPSSVRPPMTSVLAAAPSSAVLADDKRLGDSVRGSDALKKERDAVERRRERDGGNRSGTWAWLAMAAIAVAIIGVIVAKVGTGTAPSTRSTASPSTSSTASPSTSATASPSTKASAGPPAEQAVRVTPFLADMVKVPAGSFMMGSDHDGKGEKPLHRVTMTHAFYIDRTEVRADAYAACVEDGACSSNKVHAGDAVDSTYGCNTDKERPKHPANCIDRMQAEQYCTFASKRLPTEAEWEYAARGTDAREYPWGNAAPTTCAQAILTGMIGDCGDRKGTWEIGTTADGKTPFGALDMAGNVWEWVADGYDVYPASDAGSGHDAGDVVDPKPAFQASGKGILRGGSWDYSVTSAKTTYRLPFAATSGNVSTGVRCARDAE